MINNLLFLVLKGGFCSLWTQLLSVVSHVMDGCERDIDLLAELSARKRLSIFPKMSNCSFNCCKSDKLQDFREGLWVELVELQVAGSWDYSRLQP